MELRADEDDTLSISRSDDELLKELEQELEANDETGRPLSSSLAELVNQRFSKKLSDSKLKATLEKYLKSANCSRLNVPLVNNEIWKTMPKQSKRTDLQHAQIPKPIVKGSSAVVLLVCL